MTLIQRLNQYKELIGIVVFFLGGFVWLDDKFDAMEASDRQITQENQELLRRTDEQLQTKIEAQSEKTRSDINTVLQRQFKQTNTNVERVKCVLHAKIDFVQNRQKADGLAKTLGTLEADFKTKLNDPETKSAELEYLGGLIAEKRKELERVETAAQEHEGRLISDNCI